MSSPVSVSLDALLVQTGLTAPRDLAAARYLRLPDAVGNGGSL